MNLSIHSVNDVWVRIDTDEAIHRELSDHFCFEKPGAQHIQRVSGYQHWDGRIRLYKLRTHTLYRGLIPRVLAFCAERNIVCHNHVPDHPPDSFDVDRLKHLTLPESIDVRYYQWDALRTMNEQGRGIIISPTACHPAGTRVVMFDGSTIDVKDVQIGDQLMGPDGRPRHVLKRFHGTEEPLYQITTIAKRHHTYVVNGNHILSLVGNAEANTNAIVNISVMDYLNKPTYFKHIHKLYFNSTPLTFSTPPHHLPIDPYFLGLIIGDGSTIHGCNITTMDPEIINECVIQAPRWDTHLRIQDKPHNRASTYHFSMNRPGGRTNKLVSALRSLGLSGCKGNQKFIPIAYRTAPIADRFALLAGLIDTDGCLENGSNYTYTTSSLQLSRDVMFLVGSLGLAYTTRTRLINHRHYYTLRIMGDIHTIPTRIARKRLFKDIRRNKCVHRTGFTIAPIGSGDVYGFELDDDRRYLLDDFLVTHNSGKSLSIYLYTQLNPGKTLIVVPSTGLVSQMTGDFVQYGMSRDDIHQIYAAQEKHSDARIIISTWQSIFRQDAAYFNQFTTVIVDEAHEAKAKSLTTLMEMCTHVPYRFGFTGTLDSSIQVHQLVLEGLFGAVTRVATTRELQDQGYLAPVRVRMIVLKYPEHVCRTMKRKSYQDEMDFIVAQPLRNHFLAQRIKRVKGNVLTLFTFVEKHGMSLFDMLQRHTSKTCHYIDGSTSTDDREAIRQTVMSSEDQVISASFGTYARGINIPNLWHLLFAGFTKSQYRVLQSIGRTLRTFEGKHHATIWDIVDDLRIGSYVNHASKHAEQRLKFYAAEGWPVTIDEIDLDDYFKLTGQKYPYVFPESPVRPDRPSGNSKGAGSKKIVPGGVQRLVEASLFS